MVSKEFPEDVPSRHVFHDRMVCFPSSQVTHFYHARFLMFRSPNLPPAIMILMTHTGAHPQFRQEVMFLKVLHKIVWLVLGPPL